jgi:DNA polymerase-3 subunit gamma/tau
MSYQVLARKWRPKKFQEVIGQEHVTRALQNAIVTKKIGHAYMLVGTRGVGKTSVARIFAKAIRCEQSLPDGNACGECRACMDFDTDTSMNVIEIDGASNNSVENIRELISNVQYLPTSGNFRVYIIDEVHMLSNSAFNALLKTLEEPPAHVVFIFATTESHKLMGTVLSRCQRFDFRNVNVKTLSDHIRDISRIENIKFEHDDLVDQLSALGKGSVRDTLSLLEQVLTYSHNNYISEEGLTVSLGVAGTKSIRTILSAIYNGNASTVSKTYNKLLEENVPLKNIAGSLLDEIFSDIKNYRDLSEAELIWVYETIARETTWILNSIAPEKAFEVLLYKATLRRSFFSMKMPSQERTMTAESPPVAPVQADASVVPQSELATEAKLPIKLEKKELNWDNFLNDLSKKSQAYASYLEQGNILSPLRLEAGELHVELGFNYSVQVFFDYLNESEVFEKLKNHLAEYFSVDAESVYLVLRQVHDEENFISTATIKEQMAELTHQEKIENFKNNPLLKEAEKMFNAKVDKIIIDHKKN